MKIILVAIFPVFSIRKPFKHELFHATLYAPEKNLAFNVLCRKTKIQGATLRVEIETFVNVLDWTDDDQQHLDEQIEQDGVSTTEIIISNEQTLTQFINNHLDLAFEEAGDEFTEFFEDISPDASITIH